MNVLLPNTTEIGSIAFEYITRVRCGEKPTKAEYLAQISTEEDRQAFLSLVEADEPVLQS